MTVLVTGASGFIGSAVIRGLLEDGRLVRALVRANSPRDNLQDLDVEILTGDLNDPDSLKRSVAGCTGMFHLAADYRLWAPDADTMFRTNVDGTSNVMRAAGEAGVDRIVYTSSVATLGTLDDDGIADEETPVAYEHMVGPYKRSKYLAEEEVRRLIREEGLPAVIVNPSTPVGPRDIKPTPTGRVILKAAQGRIPAFVDTGLNMVHVDDVATGHLLAFGKGGIGERYILGGENMSLRELLAEVAAITGRPSPRLRLPHGLVLPVAYVAEAWASLTGGGEPLVTVDGVRLARKKMYFSSDKAKDALGYRPRPARQGFQDAISWFRDNGYLEKG